ncbi:hypothetical protein C0Q70_18244 [Pomacea canaliculata]|uniref:Band 7 domain-containing protein n=1 Tax=Pomacea canaliculata TaxID=400727 RepID=A0A2T7NMQ2_POMCA|nr:hypothetical protein C0Q70_18244 [Pomacea canaliculata]
MGSSHPVCSSDGVANISHCQSIINSASQPIPSIVHCNSTPVIRIPLNSRLGFTPNMASVSVWFFCHFALPPRCPPYLLPASPSALLPSSRERHPVCDVHCAASDSEEGAGICSSLLTAGSYLMVILFFPFSLFICIKVVQEYERAVIFRLGRLLSGGAKGPGIFFVLPCIEDYTKVDLRTVTFDIPPQEVLTRDSVTVSVDAVVYYRINNPCVSVANVANAAHSTQLLAQTTLRNTLGTKHLHEILSDRDQISESMQDVRLPIQLQRAMAAEAEAAREARAKVIAAEGEQKASLALKEASLIISESPAALQLRYLQTLSTISAEKNSTIIFPLPIEMLQTFVRK